MKKIKKQLPFNLLLFFLITAFSSQIMLAQTIENTNAGVTSIAKPSAPYSSKVIDAVHFSKVNLKEVLDILRDQFEGVQFVTNGPVERLTVDIELRSVNLSNVLKAIEIQLEGLVKIKNIEGDLVAVYAHVPDAPKPVLRAYSIAPFMETKLVEASQKNGDNLSVKELEKLKDEVLIYAEQEIHETVYRSLEMLSEAREASDRLGVPKLNIHPRTKLMIAVGSPEAVEVVGQIVSALNGQVQFGSSYGGGGLIGGASSGRGMSSMYGAGGGGGFGGGYGGGSDSSGRGGTTRKSAR